MSTIGQRIGALRMEAGLRRQQDLADKLGVDRSIVSKWERDNSGFSADSLLRISEFFSRTLDRAITVDYLLRGEVKERPILAQNDTEATPLPIPGAQPLGLTVRIPVFGTISAGEPIQAEQLIEDWEEIPVSDVKDGGEYFFLTVKGDSMVGAGILEGHRVFVRKQDYADDGDIAVVLLNGGEATLKRIWKQGDKVLLVAANGAYKPRLVEPSEVRILGKVIYGKYTPRVNKGWQQDT
jgi:repressor LexA